MEVNEDIEGIVEAIMYLEMKIQTNKADIEFTNMIIDKYKNYLKHKYPNEDIEMTISKTKSKILRRTLGE